MFEQIEFLLASWSLAYSLECYSLLKQCFQKEYSIKSARWEPLQLRHLNVWGQGLPFLVLSLGGFDLVLALQHQANSWWCSVIWEPLYFTHLDSWIWHTSAEWPHFQQFLHWGTPGFMLAPLTIAMTLLTLKCLLIIFLALSPFWVSHMLIQTIAMSNLGETLIMYGFDMRTISLKIWLFLRMCSIFLEEIQVLDLSTKYEMPMILR